MTTLAILVQDTLNLLYGNERLEHPPEDTITGTLATAAVSFVPTTTAMWKKGDYAEFPETNEVIIMAEDGDAATAIRRAQLGTTMNVGTYASGSVIVKNPSYYRHTIEKHVRAVIRNDLWPKVWTWHRDSFTATVTDFQYDLDQYVTSVALVYQENIDADERFRPLPRGWWDVERQINTTVATQGSLLVLHKVYDYDEPVYITCKRRPDIADLANMSEDLADMIPFAAASKLLAVRSGQIKNASARSRRDQEGALLRDYRGLMSEFIRMRSQYASELRLEVREDKVWRGATRRNWRTW